MNLNSKSHTPEIEKKSPITTLDAFIERQNEIQKDVESWIIKWWLHMIFLVKLLDFQKALILFYGKYLDPIEYISTLYYRENQSIETITKTIWEIYKKLSIKQDIFKTPSALQKFLTQRLHWKLKNPSDAKNAVAYQTRIATEAILAPMKKREQDKKDIFLHWFFEYGKTKDFSGKEIDEIDFLYNKFIYIIKNVFWISENDFLTLEKTWLSHYTLVNNFNALFQELGISLKIHIKDLKKVYSIFSQKS